MQEKFHYNFFKKTRQFTQNITNPLHAEDTVLQPVEHVSPPKWHLGHTTWFFENFVLKPYAASYKEFNQKYNFLFNSYYQSCGERIGRHKRSNLNRPFLEEVLTYRHHVDEHIFSKLQTETLTETALNILELGVHHEQQHQELLLMDILYIFSCNPLFPAYNENAAQKKSQNSDNSWIDFHGGLTKIGYEGDGFCYDNELGLHKKFLEPYQIQNQLVTNSEYLEFLNAGGYQNFEFWHDEAWSWLQKNNINAPLYWKKQDDQWFEFTLNGLKPLQSNSPVSHISYFEAFAYAQWKNSRLPTEFEWEHAASKINWGNLWEWTSSAYEPYPNFQKAKGALGEYNGKFMVNQQVLRGASFATPQNHSRKTYRNFYYPQQRWMFSGFRLARSL